MHMQSKGTLHMTNKDTIAEYRMRWLKGLDEKEALRKSLHKWREAACSAIAVALALLAVLIMEAYATK